MSRCPPPAAAPLSATTTGPFFIFLNDRKEKVKTASECRRSSHVSSFHREKENAKCTQTQELQSAVREQNKETEGDYYEVKQKELSHEKKNAN